MVSDYGAKQPMLNALILFLTIVTLNLNASKKMRILKADQRMTIQPRKHEKEFRDPIEDCLVGSATLAETFTLLLSFNAPVRLISTLAPSFFIKPAYETMTCRSMSMKLTIGVCAYNEEKNIKKLLGDVLNQKGLPQDTRILVVASGCTDNTAGIVRQIMRRDSRVELIEEKTRTGKANAINLVLARCNPGILVLVDADVRLPEKSISGILREMSDESIVVVGGLPIVENYESGTVAKSAAIIWRVMRQAMIELGSRGELSFVMGELYCFRTDLVERIPPTVVNDDAYVATFARSKGFKVTHATEANFVLKVPTSISDYIAQRRRVTFGHLQIKNQMGRFANIEGLAIDHTMIIALAMIREAASHPQSIIGAIFLMELETAIRLLAWLDVRTGRQHAIWNRITTTK